MEPAVRLDQAEASTIHITKSSQSAFLLSDFLGILSCNNQWPWISQFLFLSLQLQAFVPIPVEKATCSEIAFWVDEYLFEGLLMAIILYLSSWIERLSNQFGVTRIRIWTFLSWYQANTGMNFDVEGDYRLTIAV